MFQISRRDLILGAAGACAAFGLSKPVAFIGAAQAQQIPSGPGFKKYKVGDIEVFSLYDGIWEKPHDDNFPATQRFDPSLMTSEANIGMGASFSNRISVTCR